MLLDYKSLAKTNNESVHLLYNYYYNMFLKTWKANSVGIITNFDKKNPIIFRDVF